MGSGEAETETKTLPQQRRGLRRKRVQGLRRSKYTPFGSKYTGDSECGNVYVKGKYTESLTIGAANDVIVVGNTTTTGGGPGANPPGPPPSG